MEAVHIDASPLEPEDNITYQSGPIKGQYPGHVISLDQSEASVQVTWSVWTNQRSVSRSRDQSAPMWTNQRPVLPVGELPGKQNIGQFTLAVGRLGRVLCVLIVDVPPLHVSSPVSQRAYCHYPGSRGGLKGKGTTLLRGLQQAI